MRASLLGRLGIHHPDPFDCQNCLIGKDPSHGGEFGCLGLQI